MKINEVYIFNFQFLNSTLSNSVCYKSRAHRTVSNSYDFQTLVHTLRMSILFYTQVYTGSYRTRIIGITRKQDNFIIQKILD
jgi:hypothetical protein